ncbi:unnamed protein product [Ilex paraguariensis]|uniref:Uncharacterized protein n=1 Tax=Ilex paraguariensis TaxID=185542 RepID=A0ABC8T4K8_9AQUA
MNQLMVRSVFRHAITGSKYSRYISSAAASPLSAVAVVTSSDEAVVVRGQGLGFLGGAPWSWRTMSTAAEPEARKVEKESSTAVPGKKKNEESGEVVVSSYWGISRPKITREDGTEWPWNCFMNSEIKIF